MLTSTSIAHEIHNLNDFDDLLACLTFCQIKTHFSHLRNVVIEHVINKMCLLDTDALSQQYFQYCAWSKSMSQVNNFVCLKKKQGQIQCPCEIEWYFLSS